MASNGSSNSQSDQPQPVKAQKEKVLFESDRRVDAQATSEAERRTEMDRRQFLRPTTKLRKIGFVIALVIFLLVILAGFLMR